MGGYVYGYRVGCGSMSLSPEKLDDLEDADRALAKIRMAIIA